MGISENIIITHFGDQRDESSLLSDLNLMGKGFNEPSIKCWASPLSVLNLSHDYISLHEIALEVEESKVSF